MRKRLLSQNSVYMNGAMAEPCASTISTPRRAIITKIGHSQYFFRVRMNAHSSFSISIRSEEHTSELQSQSNLVCRLLLEKKQTYDDSQYPNTSFAHSLFMFSHDGCVIAKCHAIRFVCMHLKEIRVLSS